MITRPKSPFAILGAALLIIAFSAGCGDDENGNGGNGGNGNGVGDETLEISGTVSNYDGSGGELWQWVDLDDIAEGTMESDGSFTFTLTMTPEIYEENLEPLADSIMDGFGGLVCRSEFLDDVQDARFLAVHNVHYTPEGGTDSDAGTIELSTDTEDTLGSSMRPFPNMGHIYGTWLYTTEDLTIQETCDNGEIDVELQAGWNEVLIDTTEAFDEYTQWTGERPDDVDWRLVLPEE